MSKPFRFTVLILITGLIALVGALTTVELHEQSHARIFSYYGVTSEIHRGNFLQGGYVAGNMTEVDERCNADCQYLQTYHELESQYTGLLLMNMWLIYVAWLTYVYWFKEDGR